MSENQGDKFYKKLTELGISATDAANRIGISRDTIHKWFKKEYLDYRQRSKICKGLDLSENEIWGIGVSQQIIDSFPDIFKGMKKNDVFYSDKDKSHDENQIIDNFKQEVSSIPVDNYMMVEYVDLSASAGMLGGSNVDLLPETKKRLVPKEFEKGNYLVVRVNGDSMVDGTDISIPDGAEILVKEYVLENGDKLPIRGNLFVICSREGNVFKQVVEHNTDLGYIRCRSYNKKYSDYNIPLDDVFQIFIYRKIVGYRPSIPEI